MDEQHVVEHQKINANHKENGQLMLKISMLFCVWEDAKESGFIEITP